MGSLLVCPAFLRGVVLCRISEDAVTYLALCPGRVRSRLGRWGDEGCQLECMTAPDALSAETDSTHPDTLKRSVPLASRNSMRLYTPVRMFIVARESRSPLTRMT